MTQSRSPWLLLQLADGTFPNGGFAHSSGLEATMVLGGLSGVLSALPDFLDASLRQLGRAALPFVRRAVMDPSSLAEIDDLYDGTVPLLGPNHASRAQGRALASAAVRIWGGPQASSKNAICRIDEHVRRGPAHHAPVFGAVFGALGLSPDETLAAYLHGAARGVLSAGVRLGLLGALEAQRLLASRACLLETVLENARDVPLEEVAQTAPLLEIFAALHDRLDGRMFQS